MYEHIFDRGGPLALRAHKPFPICRHWYLESPPADAVVLAMLRSGHLPTAFPSDSLNTPGNPAAHLHGDSTCPWCHSDVHLGENTPLERDLPWLHIVHCLLACTAWGPRQPHVSRFCSELLLTTLDWSCYRRRLDSLLINLGIHPQAQGPCCAPTTLLYTDLLCLLADPPGFEDPPPCVPISVRTQCWRTMIACTARFLRSFRPDISRESSQATADDPSTATDSSTSTPLLSRTPSLTSATPEPQHTCNAPPSLARPVAPDVSAALPGAHLPPNSPPRRRPRTPGLPAAPDVSSDDEVPIPRLHLAHSNWACTQRATPLPVGRNHSTPISSLHSSKAASDSDDEIPLGRPYSLRSPAWCTAQLPVSDSVTTDVQQVALSVLRAKPFPALATPDSDDEVPLVRPEPFPLSYFPSQPLVRPQPAPQAGGRGRCPFGYG
jgi:hypothetical protein